MPTLRRTLTISTALLMLSASLSAPAQSGALPDGPEAGSSSSVNSAASASTAPLETAAPIEVAAPTARAAAGYGDASRRNSMRPFSTVAVAATASVGGFGAQIATPLNRQLNLRMTGVAFGYNGNFTEDGINIVGDLKFRTIGLSVDYFPFHGAGAGFHVSPGLVLYNGNNLNATANVPGGKSFQLNDQNYVSSTTDPVHGLASLTFGNRTAPSLTIGFGNMIPRSGRHFSFPIDVGFEYIGQPRLTYTLTGTACNSMGCLPIATNPDIQANLKAEQDQLNADIAPLRFYPIASIGLAYRF